MAYKETVSSRMVLLISSSRGGLVVSVVRPSIPLQGGSWFVRVNKGPFLVSLKYLLPHLGGLIICHDDCQLGIKVVVGDPSSNGGK
jgi:hypothetical protein